MSEDMIHYPAVIDQAMRGAVREVLKRVQAKGLPGEHHFYISYNTNYPGVKISEQLKSRYPNEITIVLQHQFWDFKVEQEQFQVTLSFGGMPEKLVIPFAALTAFADPSVKFGLQFQPSDASDMDMVEIEGDEPLAAITEAQGKPEDAANKIVSRDSFRKK